MPGITNAAAAANLDATGVDVTRAGVTRKRINVLDAATRTVNNNDFASPEVFSGLQQSVGGELAVIDLAIEPGDPDARLRGPELVVRLQLIHGLDQAELDAVLSRLASRWAADDRIAVLVDSLTVKLVRA